MAVRFANAVLGLSDFKKMSIEGKRAKLKHTTVRRRKISALEHVNRWTRIDGKKANIQLEDRAE